MNIEELISKLKIYLREWISECKNWHKEYYAYADDNLKELLIRI